MADSFEPYIVADIARLVDVISPSPASSPLNPA